MIAKYICCAAFALFSFSLSAQSLEEAKTMYANGEFESAKPVFEKLVKSTPNNGQYNLWYGVCCLKTGDPQTALKYLQTAVKRRTPSGQIFLGDCYSELYLFEDAIKNYEDYIVDLTKKKRPTEEAEVKLDKAKDGFRMLRNVEQVCFIDSFVVDKANFLEAYKLSEEAGSLYSFNQFFNSEGENSGTVFETELRNHIYYGSTPDSASTKIYTRHKLTDTWSAAIELPERINGSGDNNYPYVMTDGITMFFASNGESSIGGYDIFATRYNSDNDSYLLPQNIGMPFNSPYNDYMYVIDEFSNLGWFASDRYQPDNKVCIYVFVPNSGNQTYNYDSMEPSEVISLAKITSIEATWNDEAMVEEAKKRLNEVSNQVPIPANTGEFVFILDDATNYYQISDFRSAQARELFKQYQQKADDLKKQLVKLENLREEFTAADANKKSKIAPSIIDLEKRVDQMETELSALEIRVRNTEKQSK